MNISRKAISAFGVLALTMTVAACGQAGATGDRAAPTASATVSPLNEILNVVWGTNLSQEEQQRRIDEQAIRREELIAQCMNDAGFDYTPNPGNTTVSIGDDGMWQPDDREWVTQWGYGAVRSPWNARWEAEEAARLDSGEVETWTDPNQELWNTMSESELQAWQEALWGPPQDTLPEGIISDEGQILDMDAWNANRGCNGLAWAEIDADSAWSLTQADEFRDLFEAMDQMHQTVGDDPALAALELEWSNCMADAGHPGFTRQFDAQNSIFNELNGLWDEVDWETWNWETQGSPNPSNHPAWAALQEREIELALTDLDCRESVDLRGRQEAIQFAAERQFIADHRAALDALVAAAEQRH